MRLGRGWESKLHLAGNWRGSDNNHGRLFVHEPLRGLGLVLPVPRRQFLANRGVSSERRSAGVGRSDRLQSPLFKIHVFFFLTPAGVVFKGAPLTVAPPPAHNQGLAARGTLSGTSSLAWGFAAAGAPLNC